MANRLMIRAPTRSQVTLAMISWISSGTKSAVATTATYSPQRFLNHRPIGLDQLEDAVGQDAERDQQQRGVLCGECLLDQVDRAALLQVDAELVRQRYEGRQVGVEDLLQRATGPVETPHAVGQGQQQKAADAALDRKEPQDERVPKSLATQHDRCGVGGSRTSGRAQDVGATAQAAPRVPRRGGRLQPRGKGRLGGGVGGMAVQPARTRVPVEGPSGGASRRPSGHASDPNGLPSEHADCLLRRPVRLRVHRFGQ